MFHLTNLDSLTIRRIENLRTAGWGYKSIAAYCDLTRDQVRAYCQRHQLDIGQLSCEQVCAWCGFVLEGRTGRAKFCSPSCRWAAWQRQQHEMGQRLVACQGCGKWFSRVKKAQKYCCHACYVRRRFNTRGGRK